jgi:dTDP-4-amino-4,6-dideoxygalactose transaminase
VKSPIYVTQPTLPPLSDLIPLLEGIWERKVLTNNGPIHQELEAELSNHLNVEHISLVSNATLGLLIALKSLGLSGEVITTPFSFVATASAIIWAGLTPVFVDIEPDSFNIDPKKIAAAITDKTCAILPVHCYGIPCKVDEIEKIAAQHGLAVIYDAAHAFNVKCHCGSLLNHGTYSVVSFHATKVFNTFEGGMIVSQSLELKNKVDRLKNFGFLSETSISEIGINAKMHEFSAAIGLAQIKKIGQSIDKRRRVALMYFNALSKIKRVKVCGNFEDGSNYSYMPILIERNFPLSRDEVYEGLKQKGIFCRRYFYPLITSHPQFSEYRPSASASESVANEIAGQILCLPIYPDLDEDVVQLIAAFLSSQ